MSIRNGNTDIPLSVRPGVKKVVVVGESECGKTSFIRSYQSRHEPGEVSFINGVDAYPCEFQVDDAHGRAVIFEIPCVPQFLSIQNCPHYNTADVFVLMYAIDNPSSLEMLNDRWLPDIEHLINRVPAVVVGTKKDLRFDPQTIQRLRQDNKFPVTREEGEMMLTEDGIRHFFECSAYDADEVDKTFQTIFHFAVHGIQTSVAKSQI